MSESVNQQAAQHTSVGSAVNGYFSRGGILVLHQELTGAKLATTKSKYN
jgi:hypothetical protein